MITKPWEVLCVDLIGPYTLKSRNGSAIDFICLTMIDPASNWFKIVELPVAENTPTAHSSNREKTPKTKEKEPYFDKSSEQISTLVYKTWFSRYPCCQKIIYDNGSEFKHHFNALCHTYDIRVRHPVSKTHRQMLN